MKWKKVISAAPKRNLVNLAFFKDGPRDRSAPKRPVSRPEEKARFFHKLLTGMWDRDNRRC